MRFVIIAVVWVVMVGGLWLYTWRRDASVDRATPVVRESVEAKQTFALEITPTFSVEKDPFALSSDENDTSPIEIAINGSVVALSSDPIERGQALVVDDLNGVQVGHNEIHLQASPPIAESHIQHGIRIRVLEEGLAIADRTIWGSEGSLVSGTVHFELTGDRGEDHHDH